MPNERRAWVLLLTIVASAGASASGACHKDAPSSSSSNGDPTPTIDGGSLSEDGDSFAREHADEDASRPAQAQANEDARRDAGVTPSQCEARAGGDALSLIGSALDERCGVTDLQWRALADGGRGASDDESTSAQKASSLRQEARRDTDTSHVLLSLVNRGTTPVMVPLRFNADHPEQAISALAEDQHHALFELAPPTFELTATTETKEPKNDARSSRRAVRNSTLVAIDAGLEPRNFVHVHSARIRLMPSGAATVRIAIDTHVVRRLDRSCDGGGARDCSPQKLAKGHYTLHVGQLIADADVGLPAEVGWDVP